MRTAHRLAVAAALFMAVLVAPAPALAANVVTVGGSEHWSSFAAEGISWDGGEEITLDGYDGCPIVIDGSATITLVGENTVTLESSGEEFVSAFGNGMSVDSSPLDIAGDGSLTIRITMPPESPAMQAIGINAGSLSIRGCTVNIEAETGVRTTGIQSWSGDVSILEGASVSIAIKNNGGDFPDDVTPFGGIWADTTNISDSSLVVEIGGGKGDACWADTEARLINSRIQAKLMGCAVICPRILLDNCDLGHTGISPDGLGYPAAMQTPGEGEQSIVMENCEGSYAYDEFDDGMVMVSGSYTSPSTVSIQHTGRASAYAAGVQDDSAPEVETLADQVMADNADYLPIVYAAAGGFFGLILIAGIIVRVRRRKAR